jgi:flagellar protein FlgJ
MSISNSTPAVLFHDPQGLQGLKREASADPAKALLPVAKQFESVYLQMMLKSMRETVPESGLFSDEAGKAYRDMFDNQLSVNLAEQGGIGLAKVMVKQLTPAPHSAETQALQLSLRQAAVITTTTTGPVEQ